jgi:hypothetical protein
MSFLWKQNSSGGAWGKIADNPAAKNFYQNRRLFLLRANQSLQPPDHTYIAMGQRTFINIALLLIRHDPLYALQLLIAGMGLVFTVNFSYETGLYAYLSVRGVPAQARVTAVDRMQVSRIWRYYVDIAYADRQGGMHAGRRFVLSANYEPGEILAVRYIGFAPGLFILDDELRSPRYVRNAAIMLAVGLALAVLCVPRMIGFFRLTWKIRRLLHSGLAMEAEVLEIRQRPYRMGSHTPKYLLYRFTDSRGKQQTGSSITLPRDRQAALAGAKKVMVLVDPADPVVHFADVAGFFQDEDCRRTGRNG